jgi:glycosyltransferase involved in cell wall biosynthesis
VSAGKSGRRSRSRRVLILVENLSVPFDRRVWQESRALAQAGFEVDVVCPKGEKRDVEDFVELEGVRIHRYPLRPATGGALGYVREYGTAIWQSLRLAFRIGWRDPYAVIHACNPPDLFWLVALPFKLRGARFVFDHHDLVPELALSRFGASRRGLYRVSLLLERITFAVADFVISTNESYRKVAIERGGVAPDRVVVVRSAPDLDRFRPVEPDPDLKRGAPNLLCYLGVMGPQDGVDYALRSIALLREEFGRNDFHATFIGSGDAFDAYVALARELGLGDVVEFTGRVPDEVVRAYLSTADVCLAPDPKNPLNDLSTMNKIVEYLAMGRPVVSFDLVEARVSAGPAALYATANDERSFAAAIAVLLDDPERRQLMGMEGRRRVEQSLSWSVSERHLLEVYDRVLSSGGVELVEPVQPATLGSTAPSGSTRPLDGSL